MARRKRKREFTRYLDASRRLAASYVFVAPLLALYELGVTLDPRARNGADPILGELLDRFSHFGVVFLNLLLLGTLFLAIARTKAKRVRIQGLYWIMLLESSLWTCLVLSVAFLLPPARLALPGFAREITASLGAGVYEETLFRLLLMGGIILVLEKMMGGHPAWVVPLAVAVSAVLFSLAHHTLGGEAWNRQRFLFRTLMGACLGTIFWWRGLGIVVWVHALYNIAVFAVIGTDG